MNKTEYGTLRGVCVRVFSPESVVCVCVWARVVTTYECTRCRSQHVFYRCSLSPALLLGVQWAVVEAVGMRRWCECGERGCDITSRVGSYQTQFTALVWSRSSFLPLCHPVLYSVSRYFSAANFYLFRKTSKRREKEKKLFRTRQAKFSRCA